MESIEHFIPDNNELSVYFRIKKEYPLLDEEMICAMAFEDLHNEEYFNKVKEQKVQENKILLEQIENNKNKITKNGIEYFTPKDIILNKIDYSINDEVTELLNSFSNLNVNVSNEHKHKVTTS